MLLSLPSPCYLVEVYLSLAIYIYIYIYIYMYNYYMYHKLHAVYNCVGDVTIAGGVTYDFNTQTLTCISTGGPATTVTWTRDSTTVTQGNQTVLNDPVTAQYTHTLNVTGGLPGLYTCTVTNNKPSSASARITLPGMTQ